MIFECFVHTHYFYYHVVQSRSEGEKEEAGRWLAVPWNQFNPVLLLRPICAEWASDNEIGWSPLMGWLCWPHLAFTSPVHHRSVCAIISMTHSRPDPVLFVGLPNRRLVAQCKTTRVYIWRLIWFFILVIKFYRNVNFVFVCFWTPFSSTAGTVGAIVTCPLEVVKTRLQSSTSFIPAQPSNGTRGRLQVAPGHSSLSTSNSSSSNSTASSHVTSSEGMLKPEQRRRLCTTILTKRHPQVRN